MTSFEKDEHIFDSYMKTRSNYASESDWVWGKPRKGSKPSSPNDQLRGSDGSLYDDLRKVFIFMSFVGFILLAINSLLIIFYLQSP